MIELDNRHKTRSYKYFNLMAGTRTKYRINPLHGQRQMLSFQRNTTGKSI